VESFHVVNIDVPAGVGAPPLDAPPTVLISYFSYWPRHFMLK